MNTGQMLLVMLAIILFSTIIIATYNNLFTILYMAYEAMYQMQAYKIADRIFQEIDAMNISGTKTFLQIFNEYNYTDSILAINNVEYVINSSTSWCDQYGEAPADTLKNYQRIDVVIYCKVGNDTLWTGTPTHPVSYIYGDLGL
jgi:hypothetical protein